MEVYPLINVYITNWKITILNRKNLTHFDWAIFHGYVSLPEGNNPLYEVMFVKESDDFFFD